MSKIQRVNRNSPKPVLAIGETGYELSAVNDDSDKLTTHVEYVDSNISFGTMTKESSHGRDFDQRYCLWIAESQNSPTVAENYIKSLNSFAMFSGFFIGGSVVVTAVGAIFSLWSLFFLPLMMLLYFGFIQPRKPTVPVGLDSSRRIELVQKDYSVFDAEGFKKVLASPKSVDFTTHVMRLANMIGVEKIKKKYFMNWLNVAVKIMEADKDSSPAMIPYGLEDAQAVLGAILEHNRKVQVKEVTERAREKAERAAIENTTADMTEKQLADHSFQMRELSLARIRSLDQQIFGEPMTTIDTMSPIAPPLKERNV